MYRIKFGKRVGLFLMRDFKPIAEPIKNVPIFAESSIHNSKKNSSRIVDESPKINLLTPYSASSLCETLNRLLVKLKAKELRKGRTFSKRKANSIFYIDYS